MPKREVVVEPYNPLWQRQFESIRQRVLAALARVRGSTPAVEHVGSTSVPGLAAKPIIDVDIVVDARQLRETIACLAAAGYVHEGENGIAGRHAFAFEAPDEGGGGGVRRAEVRAGGEAPERHRRVRRGKDRLHLGGTHEAGHVVRRDGRHRGREQEG